MKSSKWIQILANATLGLLPRSARARFGDANYLGRFVKLASWSMIAFALEKGAQTITILFLARVLGAMEYGRLTLAQGMVNSAQLFVVLGAGTILARYIPAMLDVSVKRAIEIVNLCFVLIFGTASLLLVIGITESSAIAVSILDLPAGSSLPYWVMAWIILTALNGLLLTIMLSFEKGHVTGIVSLAVAISTIAIVPLSAAKWGLHGAIITFTLTSLLRTILFVEFYFKLLRSHSVSAWIAPSRGDLPLLFSFGLPVFLSSAIWAPTMWLAQLILKEYSPDGLISVGLFGFCNNILGLVILISSITNRAALPIMSSLKTQGNRGAERRFIIPVITIQIAASLLIAAPVVIFSSTVLSIMGGEFVGGEAVLIVMAAAGIVISGQQPLINMLLVNDMALTNLMGMAIWAVILLGLTTIFVHMGALGVAYAVLASAIVKGIFVMVTTITPRAAAL